MSTVSKPLVVGNWKMNLDFVEAVHLGQQLGVMLKNKPAENTQIVVVPPFVDLRSVSSIIESEKIPMGLGAQHVNENDNGAHTGEISCSMLKRLGVEWVLIGHSERRTKYAMTDELVTSTLQAVVRSGMKAIVCVGEEQDIREAEGHHEFVKAQLESALSTIESKFHDNVVIAYEPIWAIGTGLTATTDQVAQMTSGIREVAGSLGLSSVKVLYGGSVNAENAESIIQEGQVDGFLVGGASLKAESFMSIIQSANDCYALKR